MSEVPVLLWGIPGVLCRVSQHTLVDRASRGGSVKREKRERERDDSGTTYCVRDAPAGPRLEIDICRALSCGVRV